MKHSLQILKKYFRLLLVYLLVFQVSRIYFIVYNSDLLPDTILHTLLQAIIHGFRLDLSACAYCATPFLLIWCTESFIKRELPLLKRIFILLTLFLIALITLADAELFRAWGNKFNSQVLVYITHPIEMALSAGAINGLKTTLFAIVLLLILIGLYKTLIRFISITPVHLKNLPILIFIILFNFLILRGGTGVATISQTSAIYSEESVENAASVNSLWNALYFIFSNTNQIYGNKLNYFTANEAETIMKSQLAEMPDSIKLFNIQKPNILIVMLESFTANASQFFTGKNKCTPYMDSVARESLSFMKCYASGDRTEKGLVSVLSGYPAQPSSSIIVFPDKMGKLPSISKTLKKEGYYNLFLYGGDAEFAAMKSYLIVQQFDDIFDKRNFKSDELNSKWGAHDEYLYSNTLSKLNQAPKPFFSTIMTLSSHEPFDVPYKNLQLKKDEWYGLKNSIMYADQCLFRFLENCKKQPWYQETVIVLVADHGHDIGLENVHYFGPEKYHIPLIITGGALKKEYRGKRMEHYVSQTVIPQFLVSQLGISDKDFNWQTSAFNVEGFAQYHFNNGLGRVSNAQQCIFDNDAKRCYYYKGSMRDSAYFLNQAKAFQQALIKDFLSK